MIAAKQNIAHLNPTHPNATQHISSDHAVLKTGR